MNGWLRSVPCFLVFPCLWLLWTNCMSFSQHFIWHFSAFHANISTFIWNCMTFHDNLRVPLLGNVSHFLLDLTSISCQRFLSKWLFYMFYWHKECVAVLIVLYSQGRYLIKRCHLFAYISAYETIPSKNCDQVRRKGHQIVTSLNTVTI